VTMEDLGNSNRKIFIQEAAIYMHNPLIL